MFSLFRRPAYERELETHLTLPALPANEVLHIDLTNRLDDLQSRRDAVTASIHQLVAEAQSLTAAIEATEKAIAALNSRTPLPADEVSRHVEHLITEAGTPGLPPAHFAV